jgi:hypothetical protein
MHDVIGINNKTTFLALSYMTYANVQMRDIIGILIVVGLK